MAVSCPTSDELRAFAVGNLSATAFERIAGHVHECRACEGMLQELDGHTDGLVTGLRHLNMSATACIDVPHEVLTVARQAAAAPSNGETHTISIDPGRRYARQLAMGTCRLGKFELQAELGAGSFGYVFRAHDTELDRIVAVKIQRAGALADEEEASRFLREARSVAQLKHPGIVALHEIGQTDEGVCFLVTEFIEGQTLEAKLKSGPLVLREAAELLAKATDALQYAHAHGVVHRDLKPANILLETSREVRGDAASDTDHSPLTTHHSPLTTHHSPKLMDFGLAKRATGEMTMTSDGRVMGTPAYMSPEQARGESHTVDARSDIYSLGVILYEMLTGVRPFQGNRRLLMLQVLEDEPRPPRRLNEKIPRDLETICQKAMAKSAGRRYQTAQELGDDLRRFLEGKPIKARPVGPGERLWRWCRRNPLAASVMLAVFFGSAAGFWYLSSLSRYFVQATALDSTRMEMSMLEDVHGFYSDIVDRVDWNKTAVTHEYSKRPNAMPLPATFIIDVGQRISKTQSGMQVRVYSDHPWRPDGGPKDAFEKRTLDVLTDKARQKNVEVAYHEFTEIDGRPFLRYAKGQLMKQSCVKCHNGDKTSPKRDWQEGDLVGVLLINRSLDNDIARTHSGLQGAFLVMGLIALGLVALCFAFLVRSRLKSTVN